MLQEVIPIEVAGKRGRPSMLVTEDEAPGKLDAVRLRQLRPAFPPSSGENCSIGHSITTVSILGSWAMHFGVSGLGKGPKFQWEGNGGCRVLLAISPIQGSYG